MSSRIQISTSTGGLWDNIQRLLRALEDADAVVVGAGSGLSTSAGFTYSGERFQRYFADFEQKCGFRDMYSGGFYPFSAPEEFWAFWSRFIYINRYMDPPKDVYSLLFSLVSGKDCFVLTTNVDHCFQKAGFDKSRLFYTQGDYGLLQCSKPCHDVTYSNEDMVRKMVLAQGFQIQEDGSLVPPEGHAPAMTVPTDLLPRCPRCGRPMRMNLRADDTFVEDEGWHAAASRYADFLNRHRSGKVLYLELGVGFNTPGIIKIPFWQETLANSQAVYACINNGDACTAQEIEDRSILLDSDIGTILALLA